MRVRDWQDLIADVAERDVDPAGWRAVAGPRRRGIGEDLYLGHPAVGLFQLKTYAKNPFELRGLGGRVARQLDDELDPLLPDRDAGRFAVHQPPPDEDAAAETARRIQETVRTHAETPDTPDALFEDLMEAIEAPAYGPMAYDDRERPDRLDAVADTLEDAEALLEAEFEDLVEEDGVNRGFG